MPSISNRSVARVAGIVLLGAMLGACAQPNYLTYGDRTDSVTFQAGDAVAYNRVVQTENPWPRYARQTHIHMHGEKADLAIDRYKSDQVKEPKGFTTTGGAEGGDASE